MDAKTKVQAGEARLYFAVPDHYGIGEEFDTFTDAERAALLRIREIDGCPGSFTRAFVDVRQKDATGDHPLHRIEVLKFRLDNAVAAAYADDAVEHIRAQDEMLHGLGEIDGGGF